MTLDSKEKVKLLAPRNTKDGYLIESGFITTDKNIDIPNSNTIWSVSRNNKLTNQSPVKLSSSNELGVTSLFSTSEGTSLKAGMRVSSPLSMISPADFT